MAVYRCRICGAIFDEAKEGKKLSEIPCCPVCKQPISNFEKIADAEETKPDAIASSVTAAADAVKAEPAGAVKLSSASLAYDEAYARVDERCRYMKEIHEMAVTGRTIGGAMGTQMPMPGWDDILLLGAQLNPPPLEDDAPVETRTVIGKHAKKPMVLDSPVYISHMSFGALSKETKVALAKGSALAKTAMCSGEGGILPEEKAASYKYIFEYIPNKYSVTDENLKTADAIEIKIGQGTKPGMGGHLPGEKVTPEIAALRGKKPGEDVEGRPIGIKIAAGRIEQDLEHCVFAQPDFITIDGRGGATGSSPFFLREATTVPTVYALSRARKYLDSVHSDIALVITGGLRVSPDFAKALAMGADAIAIASAALIAAACQQYRICGSGNCPVGIATQNPELRARLNMEAAVRRVANFLNVSLSELKTFARITGHSSVHDLSLSDLITLDKDIEEFTGIPHAGRSIL